MNTLELKKCYKIYLLYFILNLLKTYYTDQISLLFIEGPSNLSSENVDGSLAAVRVRNAYKRYTNIVLHGLNMTVSEGTV